MRVFSYRQLWSFLIILSVLTAFCAPGLSVSAKNAPFYATLYQSGLPVSTIITASTQPTLSVVPVSLTFSATQGSNPLSQAVSLTANSGNITYSLGSSANWLSASPITGTIISGTTVALTVTANPATLSPNVYKANLSITNTSYITGSLSLPITFSVAAPPIVTPTSYIYYLPSVTNQYSSSPAVTGSFTSYLAFQNTGSGAATVNLNYFDANGTPITTSNIITSVAQFGEALPPNPVMTGTMGSGVISSSQPLNVLVSERTPYGGSSYAVNAGANSQLIAPLLLKNFYGGFTTQLTVLNAGSSAVTATVNIYDENGVLQTAASKVITLAAHTANVLDQSDPTSGLPTSFNGWAQISSTPGALLVAQVLEQNPSQQFAALVNAKAAASTVQYAPAIFNGAYGGFVTGANIVNPNSVPITVNITYYNYQGQAFAAPPFTVTAGGVVGVYQPATDAYRGIPTGGLTAPFTGGAIITATSGIVVMVNEQGGTTVSGAARSGTYSAVNSGSTQLGLPALANGGIGFTSGATLFNISSTPVSGTVQYYNLDGSPVGNPQNFNIAGGTGSSVVPNANLPTGFYGTAVVSILNGQPNSLVATANMQSDNFFYTYTEPTQ